MKTVWKYELEIRDEQTLRVPRGAVVRHVGAQDGKLCLWAEVETELGLAPLDILIVGTGHPIPDRKRPSGKYGGVIRYYGSAVMPPFVWHVYGG